MRPSWLGLAPSLLASTLGPDAEDPPPSTAGWGFGEHPPDRVGEPHPPDPNPVRRPR